MTGHPTRTTIIIADDHPLVLRGLTELIAHEPDMQVLATCSDGTSARDCIRTLVPDIAVLDHRMPGLSGLEILRQVKADGLGTRLALLTADLSDADAATAIALGIEAVIIKSAAPESLLTCLREVSAGRRYIPAEMLEAADRDAHRRMQFQRIRDLLTEREREIVALACAELSNKEIARKLEIAEGTVKIHLNNIFTKLNVANRAALMRTVGPYLSLWRGEGN